MDLADLSFERLGPSVTNLGAILSFLVLNKQLVHRDIELENKLTNFLTITQTFSAVGFSLGALVAARKAKLRPLFNSAGLVFGAFIGWPLSEKFHPLPPADLPCDVARYRRALVGAAVGAGVGPLFGRGLLAGAQLGLAASWTAEQTVFRSF